MKWSWPVWPAAPGLSIRRAWQAASRSRIARRAGPLVLNLAIAAFVVGLWLVVFTRGAVLWP